MIKTAIGRVAKAGVSPEMLLVRAKILRALGLIPKQQDEKSGQVRRIFFSFPYHQLGDFILALTLLERTHQLWPAAEIDVAVGAAFASLVDQIPYVQRVFPIIRPPRSDIGFGVYREFANLTKCYREQIASRQYDLAISPRWGSLDSHFGAYLAYLTGAPVRCGYSGENDGIRPGVDRLYTVSALGGAFEHESLRYSRLLGRCCFEAENAAGEEVSRRRIGPLWDVAQQRRASAEPPLAGRYVVVSPGASFLNKRWPLESFAAAARHLRETFGLQVVVVGSSSEAEICRSLCHLIGEGAISLAGKTEILKLVDVIAGAELFLGNDSGSSHIAGGLGLKTVVVNAFPADCKGDIPNSPVRFRPVGTAVRVVQPEKNLQPCTGMCTMNWQHCIQQVQTEKVNAALDSLFAMDGN
jgi:ADP-heptose:LPS heptosyltransferase